MLKNILSPTSSRSLYNTTYIYATFNTRYTTYLYNSSLTSNSPSSRSISTNSKDQSLILTSKRLYYLISNNRLIDALKYFDIIFCNNISSLSSKRENSSGFKTGNNRVGMTGLKSIKKLLHTKPEKLNLSTTRKEEEEEEEMVSLRKSGISPDIVVINILLRGLINNFEMNNTKEVIDRSKLDLNDMNDINCIKLFKLLEFSYNNFKIKPNDITYTILVESIVKDQYATKSHFNLLLNILKNYKSDIGNWYELFKLPSFNRWFIKCCIKFSVKLDNGLLNECDLSFKSNKIYNFNEIIGNSLHNEAKFLTSNWLMCLLEFLKVSSITQDRLSIARAFNTNISSGVIEMLCENNDFNSIILFLQFRNYLLEPLFPESKISDFKLNNDAICALVNLLRKNPENNTLKQLFIPFILNYESFFNPSIERMRYISNLWIGAELKTNYKQHSFIRNHSTDKTSNNVWLNLYSPPKEIPFVISGTNMLTNFASMASQDLPLVVVCNNQPSLVSKAISTWIESSCLELNSGTNISIEPTSSFKFFDLTSNFNNISSTLKSEGVVFVQPPFPKLKSAAGDRDYLLSAKTFTKLESMTSTCIIISYDPPVKSWCESVFSFTGSAEKVNRTKMAIKKDEYVQRVLRGMSELKRLNSKNTAPEENISDDIKDREEVSKEVEESLKLKTTVFKGKELKITADKINSWEIIVSVSLVSLMKLANVEVSQTSNPIKAFDINKSEGPNSTLSQSTLEVKETINQLSELPDTVKCYLLSIAHTEEMAKWVNDGIKNHARIYVLRKKKEPTL